MKVIPTFLFETDFFEQVSHKLSFIYKKNSKVCTQLRIFQKEIKSTLNRAHAYIRRKRLISKSDYNFKVWMHLKVFLKLKKT
jgi:hypothetical protein